MATLCSLSINPLKTIQPSPRHLPCLSSSTSISKSLTTHPRPPPPPPPPLRIPGLLASNFSSSWRPISVVCSSISTAFPNNTNYEFNDGTSEVELRLRLTEKKALSSKDIFVDADGRSLVIRIQHSGFSRTVMETNQLYDRIKPSETIWYLDDDQLVVNLTKQDPELKWPDIVESWESLTTGIILILKGTSIYLVGESTEINQKVAQELAVGLGYTPLDTKGLLETLSKQTIDSWVTAEGSDSVANAETEVLESLSSHVRAVVATLGEGHSAASRADKWQYLYAGFTVWLSLSQAKDEASAKEEARRQVHDSSEAYAKADVVVKLGGWDAVHAKAVAQAALSALKQLILNDKNLPGKKSLYIRLGCRGDWPNIKPPGWDPSDEAQNGFRDKL
ncbi:Probable inactive shikimate kinase like 2, chloroplastic [Dionaea muscipula]